MVLIYHNRDLDGFCSGAIMQKKYPFADARGYDYGQPLSLPILREVIMADVSLPMPSMMEVAKTSNGRFTWIDHHKSAIKDYEKLVADLNHNNTGEEIQPFKAILFEGLAACELTWGHLYSTRTPLAVTLLGEYDTWRNQDKERWENEILPFQFGMRLICNSLETFPAELLEEGQEAKVQEIIEKGKTILAYQRQVNEFQCKRAFEIEFEGLRAICINAYGNSDVFKSVYDENKHDLMIMFQWIGNTWSVTLYSTKESVDCSVLAKAKGGGGHRGAAGFKMNDIKSIINGI